MEPAGEASLRAATAGDVTVALDLALTEGLRRKGLVRQLVHQVQLLRKSAGLAVDDRIRLVVTAGAESRDAFEEHRAYICAETLALEMSFGAPSPGFVSRDARLDGGAVTLALARAARAEPAPLTGRARGFSTGLPPDPDAPGLPRPWTCPPTAG